MGATEGRGVVSLRLDARIVRKAANIDALRQGFPSMPLDQQRQDRLKRHAVKRIVRVVVHSAVRI